MWLWRFALQDIRAHLSLLRVFIASLFLGVTLIAATGGLYQLVMQGLLSDTRALLGGDLEIDANGPLPADVEAWIRQRAEVSLLKELDTMISDSEGERFFRSEILVTDETYPLYGRLQLQPERPLSELTASDNGLHGIVVDPLLAERLEANIGDSLEIGFSRFQIRAFILEQPDRRLSANWRGLPILMSEQGLQATGLVRPGSRIDYEYRLKVSGGPEAWEDQFFEAFPDGRWEVQTFADRSERISERLDQVATALLLVGFTTLFIGGLGVATSVKRYLDEKLETMATLLAIGLRPARLQRIYLFQVGLVAAGSGLAGILAGATLTRLVVIFWGESLGLKGTLAFTPSELGVYAAAFLFALLTAYAFALPTLARALGVDPAGLFRGHLQEAGQINQRWQITSAAVTLAYLALFLALMPSPLFGLGFLTVVAVLLLLLHGLVRCLQAAATRLENRPGRRSFAWHLALANLHRPDSPLKITLLALGSALTLIVACSLLVGTLLRALNSTIPEEAPTMVLYEIFPDQQVPLRENLAQVAPQARLELLPIIRARLDALNETKLSELQDRDTDTLREAQGDEYKLSYLSANPDNLVLIAGSWWESPAPEGELPYMAMEDREANELGIRIGDRLVFNVGGQTFAAQVRTIYAQKGLQTRFWFEGILQDGALEPFINRYVGAMYASDHEAKALQQALLQAQPNILTLRTAELIETAGDLLGKAAIGLLVISAISLTAGLLVMASVVSVSRSRQLYEANILHCIGARHSAIQKALLWESALLAILCSTFSILLGAAIALPLAEYRLKLPAVDLLGPVALLGIITSMIALLGGLLPMLRRLRFEPARLLRDS